MYKRFGIFRYAEELLLLGIPTPSEQITAILWLVQFDLASPDSVPTFVEEAAFDRWMKGRVGEALTRLGELGGVAAALHTASLATD